MDAIFLTRKSEKIELIHPISSIILAENWSQASIFHGDYDKIHHSSQKPVIQSWSGL